MTSDDRRDYSNKKYDQFAQCLGRLALAWNSLHLELFEIFWAVSGYGNGMIPGAIWYALKVDRAQRDILKDLVNSKAIGINLSKDQRREIKWVLDKTDNLENIRNDFIHTPFAMDNSKVFPLHTGQHKRGLSFEGRAVLAESNWVFKSVSVLSIYAEQLAENVRKPTLPMPERPKLPTRP